LVVGTDVAHKSAGAKSWQERLRPDCATKDCAAGTAAVMRVGLQHVMFCSCFLNGCRTARRTERPFRDFVGSGGCVVARKIGQGRRIFPPSAARNDERRTGREIANRRNPDSSAGIPDELAEESTEAAADPQEGPCPVQADSNTNLRPAPAAGWIFCPGQGSRGAVSRWSASLTRIVFEQMLSH
jgi:hypothetical protein